MTALHCAVVADNVQIVELLIHQGANIGLCDKKGNSTLLLSTMYPTRKQIVQMILSADQSNVNAVGDKGRQALHWGVGDPLTTQVLLQASPQLNTLDDNGASPLLLAIAHGQPESARMLIEAGCDVAVVYGDGRRALHHACLYGLPDTLNLLLQAPGQSTDTATKDGKAPILLAAMENHDPVVKLLIEAGAAVDIVYKDAITPLFTAVTSGWHGVVKTLLQSGADPDLIGKDKHPPLISAVLEDDMRACAMLIQAGATLKQVSPGHPRALFVALAKDIPEAVLILATYECDVNYIRELLEQPVTYIGIGNNAPLLGYLRDQAAAPRPLQMLARKAIRDVLSYPLHRHINLLPVPQKMKDYIIIKDIWKLVKED